MKKELLELLLKYGIIGFNFVEPIRLKSGIYSPIYCNFRKCLEYPKIRKLIVTLLAKEIKRRKLIFSGVISVATGAIPWGTLLANHYNLPKGYVRPEGKAKDYGLKNLVEGMNVSGQPVLLVEDSITTGGSVIDATQILLNAGAKKVEVVSIFSYNFDFAKKNFEKSNLSYSSVLKIEDVISSRHLLKEYIHDFQFRILQSWNLNPVRWSNAYKKKNKIKDNLYEPKTFTLSKEDVEKFEKWEKSLPKLEQGHFGASGGGITFSFCPTGLGTIVTVTRADNPKKHKLDLSDMEKW